MRATVLLLNRTERRELAGVDVSVLAYFLAISFGESLSYVIFEKDYAKRRKRCNE
jgi:hypothetical protein